MNLFHLFMIDFKQGGYLMVTIFAVAIVSWIVGINKCFTLARLKRSRKKFLKQIDIVLSDVTCSIDDTGCEQYDYLLHQIIISSKNNGKGKKGIMREFLIGTVPVLEKSFSTMSAWISVAPLLGLLGTVIGMIQTFKVIMDFGIGNPNLTAEGISVALLTTQAGLTAAFPAMIFHNFLINRKDLLLAKMFRDCENLVNRLDSVGLDSKDVQYV